MLGHRKITQTQRYAKLMAMDVYSQFDKVMTAMELPDNKRSDDAIELPDNERSDIAMESQRKGRSKKIKE
jgi:hypothetical protein